MDAATSPHGGGGQGRPAPHASAEEIFASALEAERRGQPAQAESLYRQLIAAAPALIEPRNNLATLLIHQGRFDQAVVALQDLLDRCGDRFEIHANLGLAWHGCQQYARAAEHFERALALHPALDDIRRRLAETCMALGQDERALGVYQALLDKDGDDLAGLVGQASVCFRLKRLNEAYALYRRAIQLRPDNPGIHNDLALVERNRGRYTEARRLLEKALELDANYRPAYSNLGIVYQNTGQQERAVESYRKAIELDPRQYEFHSNLLLCMHYVWGMDPREIHAESLQWARRHAPPRDVPPHPNKPEPGRRLKIGYISPDIRTHSVAYFLEPILDAHDRRRVELYCYAHVQVPDQTTHRLKAKFDHYRNIADLATPEVVELIRRDGVDILVDLAGHAGNERLVVLGYKPAPVQATYLGYPGTTGMSQVDYRLSDAWSDGPGAEELHSEQVVRLPGGFLCYKPPPTAPPVGPLPRDIKGYVTFGSFSSDAKVTSRLIGLWARVLAAVPNSQMLLKFSNAGDDASRQYYLQQFESHGIDRSRIQIVRRLPSVESHLSAYAQVDLVLDTYPYHGTTTTCEAMWMGVPVVTLAGEAHVSRVGVSLLDAVGLGELAAASEDEYVAKAARLAASPARLAGIRQSLRQRMAGGRLCNAAAFTRALELAYRGMWCRWCRRQGAALTSEQEASAAFDFSALSAASDSHPKEVDPMSAQPTAAASAARPPVLSQSPVKMARPVNIVELAVLADAMYRLGHRASAVQYAAEALDALATGQNASTPPRALLETWQAGDLRGMLVRLCVLLGGFSTYFHPARAKNLLVNWSSIEPQNPQPFLRFGLTCLLEATTGRRPLSPAAVEALRYAHSLMQDERSALALTMAQAAPAQVALPYDHTTIHLYPSIANLTTYVLLEQGDWFEDDINLFRALVRPGDAVLDLGANVGVYSLSAAVRTEPPGRVVSVEPCRSTYELLARSAAAHPHMTALHAAVGETSGTVRLAPGNAPELNRVQGAGEAAAGGEEVRCFCVDDLADHVGAERFDLIKMDVEGLEIPTIRGAARIMGEQSPIIFYEFKEGTHVHLDLVDEFAGLGYDSYYFSPGRNALIRYQKGESLDPFLLNMIAIRPDSLNRFDGIVPIL